jgi:hypothetical protein
MNRLSFTFKQWLAEEDRKIYAKQLGAVADFTPDLAEGDYRVGEVTFSAKDGLGSVPFNQSVYYHGFVALMKPSVFLGIVLDDEGHQDGTAKEIAKLILKGYALGPPFLNLDTLPYETDGSAPKITGHEGRGRMKACLIANGDSPVPVHVFLQGGLRSRHLTPELIAAIKGRIQAERSTRVVNSPFEGIFVNGKAA